MTDCVFSSAEKGKRIRYTCCNCGFVTPPLSSSNIHRNCPSTQPGSRWEAARRFVQNVCSTCYKYPCLHEKECMHEDALILGGNCPLGLWREYKPNTSPSVQYKLSLEDHILTSDLSRGVVTGASSNHWCCLGALVYGAVSNGVGLAVADHGLEYWQHMELDRVGVVWVYHDKPIVSKTRRETIIHSHINAWWKPWVCLASPFDTSVWIDSDAVVVGDLSPLFEMAENQFCLSSQILFGDMGKPLYYPIVSYMYGSEHHAVDIMTTLLDINTGIIGWRRGESLIMKWRDVCSFVIEDPVKVELCNVRDQSAMAISLIDEYLNGGLDLKLLSPEWNVPAENLTRHQLNQRRKVSPDPSVFLREAIERHPGAKVVHWLGRPKPWELLR